MQNATILQRGPWVLRSQPRPHPAHPGLLAAELRHERCAEPVIDLRDGPFAPVVFEFGPGPILRIELAVMANPLGGVIRAEIDLENGDWTGAGSNGRQPVSRFIDRFANPGTPRGPWPVVPIPVPSSPPSHLPPPTPPTPPPPPPAASAPSRPPVHAVSPPVEARDGADPALARAAEAPASRPVGLRREMRSKDGVWLFDLEENGRFELTASGRERPYYDVRVVRVSDGKVVADTRSHGYEGWVIGDEIQLSRPGSREPWIAVDTVYGEFWSENVRGPLSEVQDVANLAREW